MTISALDQAAADFRAALLRRDDAALKRLMTAYQPAYTRMQARVAALTAQIATAQAAGETVRPSWLVERGRLETLQHQIVSEWARFADVAEQVITDTQRAAVVAAHTEAHQLTLAALHDARVTWHSSLVAPIRKWIQTGINKESGVDHRKGRGRSLVHAYSLCQKKPPHEGWGGKPICCHTSRPRSGRKSGGWRATRA